MTTRRCPTIRITLFFYDVNYGSGAYITDNDGNVIDPTQSTQGIDAYKNQSHEIRIATTGDGRVKAVGGLPAPGARHPAEPRHRETRRFVGGDRLPRRHLADEPAAADHDYAAFGEVTFDATDKWSFTWRRALFQGAQLADRLLRLRT